eukprot:985919-Alexandrium_andersonii.AAC.1
MVKNNRCACAYYGCPAELGHGEPGKNAIDAACARHASKAQALLQPMFTIGLGPGGLDWRAPRATGSER